MRQKHITGLLLVFCIMTGAAVGADRIEIESVNARLFLGHTGSLSAPLTAKDALWNTIIGEGSAREPSKSTLIDVVVKGAPGKFDPNWMIDLVVTRQCDRRHIQQIFTTGGRSWRQRGIPRRILAGGNWLCAVAHRGDDPQNLSNQGNERGLRMRRVVSGLVSPTHLSFRWPTVTEDSGSTPATDGNQIPLVKLTGHYWASRACPAAQLARFVLRSALVLSRNATHIFSIA